MKNIPLLLLFVCLVSTNSWAQQTIQQTIYLKSNTVNSTEILFYKQDNTSYYSLHANNGGFGLYNSTTSATPLFINSSDNVGIGTKLPTEKLSVKGKIRALEIKVETANWPDYVFAKDYKLPSLKETERYIKDKGHLHGIPSAEEVATNGVDLGEMNAKLLKKIEELTLYLIDQSKEIKELKEEVKSLKNN